MSECHTIPNASCESEFADIKKALASIDTALRGNGVPGIKQRIDSLERLAGVLTRLIWIMVIASSPLLVATVIALIRMTMT